MSGVTAKALSPVSWNRFTCIKKRFHQGGPGWPLGSRAGPLPLTISLPVMHRPAGAGQHSRWQERVQVSQRGRQSTEHRAAACKARAL